MSQCSSGLVTVYQWVVIFIRLWLTVVILFFFTVGNGGWRYHWCFSAANRRPILDPVSPPSFSFSGSLPVSLALFTSTFPHTDPSVSTEWLPYKPRDLCDTNSCIVFSFLLLGPFCTWFFKSPERARVSGPWRLELRSIQGPELWMCNVFCKMRKSQ